MSYGYAKDAEAVTRHQAATPELDRSSGDAGYVRVRCPTCSCLYTPVGSPTATAPTEIDRATFMLAITRLRQVCDSDPDAQDILAAVVRYVGRLETAIDAGVGWDHV